MIFMAMSPPATRERSRSSSTDAQAVLPTNYTFTRNDAGSHTFSATLQTPGTQSLTVTDASPAGLTVTQSNIIVNPSVQPAVALAVSGLPTTMTAGNSFAITVSALTSNNTPATGYRGTVHFASTDGQAILPTDYAFTSGDAGAHTFNVTLKTAATQSITVTDSMNGLASPPAGTSVNPANAALLTLGGFPSTVTAGAVKSFTLTASDPYGNVATGYMGTVHFSSSDSSALLPIDYTFLNTDAGKHAFTAALQTAGSQSITAAGIGSGLTVTQSNITVNPATTQPALALAISGLLPTNIAGNTFTITVSAITSGGTLATGYTGTVHFTSPDSQAVLPANYTFTNTDAGIAYFHGYAEDRRAGSDDQGRRHCHYEPRRHCHVPCHTCDRR